MIKIESESTLPKGDILLAPEKSVICTTNIVGAMGRGLALSTKLKYPNVYKIYREVYLRGDMYPDTLINCRVGDGKSIVLFPTKTDWRKRSDVDMIINNIIKLASLTETFEIESLAIPPLGMANGWLRFDESRKVIDCLLNTFSQDNTPECTLYLPEAILKSI